MKAHDRLLAFVEHGPTRSCVSEDLSARLGCSLAKPLRTFTWNVAEGLLWKIGCNRSETSAAAAHFLGAQAPAGAKRGAHPFCAGRRPRDGTGPPLVPPGKYHLNQKFLCCPKKRSEIEIDAGAAAEAAGEQKPVAAGMVAEEVVLCSQRPAHAAQDRFFFAEGLGSAVRYGGAPAWNWGRD